MRNSKTRVMSITAMFAAIASLLMFFEMPLPFMPPFLKLDISSVPVLILGFMFGPMPAVMAAAVKAIVHVFSTQTGGVGELADFLITSSFAVSASLVYMKNKSKKGALLGCAVGVVAITIVGMLANKFLLIPFFMKVMPIEAIVGACAAINPLIGSIDTYIIFGAGPFNMIKGIIVSFITILVYKRVSTALKSEFKRNRVLTQETKVQK